MQITAPFSNVQDLTNGCVLLSHKKEALSSTGPMSGLALWFVDFNPFCRFQFFSVHWYRYGLFKKYDWRQQKTQIDFDGFWSLVEKRSKTFCFRWDKDVLVSKKKPVRFFGKATKAMINSGNKVPLSKIFRNSAAEFEQIFISTSSRGSSGRSKLWHREDPGKQQITYPQFSQSLSPPGCSPSREDSGKHQITCPWIS